MRRETWLLCYYLTYSRLLCSFNCPLCDIQNFVTYKHTHKQTDKTWKDPNKVEFTVRPFFHSGIPHSFAQIGFMPFLEIRGPGSVGWIYHECSHLGGCEKMLRLWRRAWETSYNNADCCTWTVEGRITHIMGSRKATRRSVPSSCCSVSGRDIACCLYM